MSIATAGFFVACDDDPSSPNNANSAQENVLPEETVNSSNSVKAISVSSSGKKEDTPVYTVETGTVIDERDGQIYKTVTIGTQTWLAQNLNYETVNSFCYNDTASYCDKYGRLYTWDAAMDACPSGWHLPSMAEFETMIAAIDDPKFEGVDLKSTSGWSLYDYGCQGKDKFGFSALPAGGRLSKRSYEKMSPLPSGLEFLSRLFNILRAPPWAGFLVLKSSEDAPSPPKTKNAKTQGALALF